MKLLIYLLSGVLSTRVTFDNKLAISNSISNSGEPSNYDFKFQLATDIEPPGFIRIVFPSQFPSDLGIPTSSALKCSQTCSQSGRVVNVYFSSPLKAGQSYSVTIFGVKNPESPGGVANFYIQSLNGNRVVDENLSYGVIGIASGIRAFDTATVKFDQESSNFVGQSSKYVFEFRTSVSVAKGIYIRLYLPKDQIGVPDLPPCNAVSVNRQYLPGSLTCQKNGNFSDWDVIDITGVEGALEAQTSFGIEVSLSNPLYSQITDSFGIALIRSNTNVIYQRKMDILGLSIKPAPIIDIRIESVDPNLTITRNKLMWFRLTFTPSNYLTDKNMIILQIPASLKLSDKRFLGYAQSYFVEYGLESNSTFVPIITTFDSATNILSIRGFKSKSDLYEVSVVLLLTTPDNLGESSSIQISTLTSTSNGFVIDQDDNFAKITVENVISPTTFSIQASNSMLDVDGNILSSVTVYITPTITIPKLGYIQLILSDSLAPTELGNQNCLVQASSDPTDLVPTTCNNFVNKLTLQITTTFYLSSTYIVQLKNAVYSPQLPGDHNVDVTTLLPDGSTALESFTAVLTIRPINILSGEVHFLSNEKNEKSLMKISFQSPVDLSESSTGVDDGSIISVVLNADAAFTVATGYGFSTTDRYSIPCISTGDLTPVTGLTVSCILVQSPVLHIQIKNYNKLVRGKHFELQIPNFKNFAGQTKVTVSLFSQLNQRLYQLAGFTVSVPIGPSLTSNKVTDYSALYDPTYYTVSTLQVATPFSLTFDLKLSQKVAHNERLVIVLPMYSTGFCVNRVVSCAIQGTYYDCSCIPGADWIFIQLGIYDEIPVTDAVITIKGLQWPVSVNTKMGNVSVRVVDVSDATKQYYMYPAMPSATPHQFLAAELATDLEIDSVDAKYSFAFTIDADIPADGKLVLDLPIIFDLTQSDPAVRVSCPEFEASILLSSSDSSSLTGLSYFMSSTQIIISGLPQWLALEPFTVNLLGVYSPNYKFKVDGFNVRVLTSDGFLIAMQDDFASFVFLDKSPTPEIGLTSISLFPINANALATYTFNFTMPVGLSKGTQLNFNFPDEYLSLPADPECFVGGTLTSFDSCFTSLRSVVLKLDETISAGEITVTIKSILNPDKGTTGYFSISSLYDSQVTSISNSLPNHRVNITKAADTIAVDSNELNPSNEGEIADFSLSFFPTILLDSSKEIVVIFPRKFDSIIGANLKCSAISGLSGSLPCSVNQRALLIQISGSYIPDSDVPVGIKISGLIVPNKNPQIFTEGYIALAVRKINDQNFLNYNQEAIQPYITNAPSWLSINSLVSSNFDCRYTSILSVNITLYSSLPSSLNAGRIYLDLPTGFDTDFKRIRASSYSTGFGNYIEAQIVNNRVVISGNSEDFSGNFYFKLFGIDNPKDEVATSAFIIRTFDGQNMKIIERCYENLDPIYFNYTYPGPLIVVNNDKPIRINKGTVTENIPVYVENLAALNLALSVTYEGIFLYPAKINIPLGSQTVYFAASVTQDSSEGSFQFSWKLEGEKIPKIYTPLKVHDLVVFSKTPILIACGYLMNGTTSLFNTSNSTNTSVSPIPSVNSTDESVLDDGSSKTTANITFVIKVPLGGRSLPIVVELEHSPDIEIVINLNLKIDYPGLSIVPHELHFGPQVKYLTFNLLFTNGTGVNASLTTEGGVDLQLSGVNSALYALNQASINFAVIAKDDVSPTMASLTSGEVSKNNAQVFISTSESCNIYYAVGLQGMQQPSFEEVYNKKINHAGLFFVLFGGVTIYDNGVTNRLILIENLLPEFTYIAFFYLEDTGGNVSGPFTVSFKTRDRDNAADVSLRLKQSYLTYQDKLDIVRHIALLLSLPTSKLMEKKYYIDPSDSQQTITGRLLEQTTAASATDSVVDSPVDEMSILFNFNILASPENSAYPTPKDLGLSLNSKIAFLSARIRNFDKSYPIQSSEFVSYTPKYTSQPAIANYTYNSVIVTLQFDLYGWLFAVAVPSSENQNSPTGLQISLGVDAFNIATPSGRVEVSERYAAFNLTISGLEAVKKYKLYAIGANAQPGYPQLMDDKYIVELEFTTLEEPVRDFIDLSGQIVSTFIAVFVVAISLAII